MTNPNTPEYWDEQFEKEWKVITTKETASGATGYRWDYLRFGVLGCHIIFKGKLLDIGCGMGPFCRYIKARNPLLKVHGVDFSPFAIKKAKEIDPTIDFRLISELKLPFPDNYFDIITAQEIIEHLDNPHEAIQEWKRVLKPNKKLFITTPWKGSGKYYLNKEFMSDEHVKEWEPKEFQHFLKKYFRKVELIYPPALLNIYGKKLLPSVWFLSICEK